MNKRMISLAILLVMLCCSATAAVAQNWSWETPIIITPSSGQYIKIKFYPRFTEISGKVNADTPYEPLVLGDSVSSTSRFTDLAITDVIGSVFAPPVGMKYVVDNDTIALATDGAYDALDAQPFIPAVAGKFTSIAAGPDEKLYVLFDADNGTQYLLVGTSLNPPETVKVRFAPRSLNLGSNGRWISCQISGLPEGYTPADVDPDSVCIVAVNGRFLARRSKPICSINSGGLYNKNPKKLILKFDRKELADFITTKLGPNTSKASITLAGFTLDGLVQFYGKDVIKVKTAKVKNMSK